jgi:hypothetical protein
MNFEFQHLLPSDFHPASRVWVYQASRLLTLGEALEAGEMLDDFIESWNSHGARVKGYGNLFFGQFVILMADETKTGVGGCSTDSSVRVIKKMEEVFKVNMFDRQSLAFVIKEEIQLLPLSQVPYALENNFITPDTIYFNNLVQTKQELETKWKIPVRSSWLASRFKVAQ